MNRLVRLFDLVLEVSLIGIAGNKGKSKAVDDDDEVSDEEVS